MPISLGDDLLSRSFFSVYSDVLSDSCQWYTHLFKYQIAFESDWFVHLQAGDAPALELGIILRSHEIVPDSFRSLPSGGMLTLVVEDVDALHQDAIEFGAQVLQTPRDLFYGQRRMLLVDPNGLLVDVSSECPPDPMWLASLNQS